eukprot:9455793-Prorocentrum_lima.AAC.1
MTSSLVGSEMCIRDRLRTSSPLSARPTTSRASSRQPEAWRPFLLDLWGCLLYTSDAADDM